MQDEKLRIPDYLFEVSWEVCNKVGGIHTVISTKASCQAKLLKNAHILIGPDVLKENEANPEFIEEVHLMKAWKTKAAQEGLRIRTGKWNISGKTIVILVDFTTFFSEKDNIFKSLWEQYKLDSISGQWDYIEPALFGYASGKVIESYVRFHCSFRDRIIAQFHEWMTGAGLLYLRQYMPQVGCAFTTHATVLGRCIAGNNLPLYDKLASYNPDNVARDFSVISKQSLEKITAQASDVFTTVSDITAKECEHFLSKPVDIVTPNGFQDLVAVNDQAFIDEQKKHRKKFIDVAEAILGTLLSNDTLLVGIGGRYEFKNKGIDVLIDALGKLNQSEELTREVVAFILVPAGHLGASKELIANLEIPQDERKPLANPYLTHNLYDPQFDPVLNRIKANKLENTKNDKVKIFFAPSYLNGNDGIFDVQYYDMLAALDLSVFPSYYEPWGYTPLESLAFKVPTITTTLAGFGLWVKTHYEGVRPGISIIDRTDTNDNIVVEKIAARILKQSKMLKSEYQQAKENAYDISRTALWDNLIEYYQKAYDIALEKVSERYKDNDFKAPEEIMSYTQSMSGDTTPNWSQILVRRTLPENLVPLDKLSRNLWWCWNQDAIDLFDSIDNCCWKRAEYNPIQMLDMISYQRYQELEKDKEFVVRLNRVYARFEDYMSKKKDMQHPFIAYFSMEYGLHNSLKIYSGGLGILAGDYLKEASDKGTHIIGVGLLYRYGYFTQRLSAAGDQVPIYEQQQFDKIPVTPVRDEHGNWVTIEIAFPGRMLKAHLWCASVGRVELYLLDTDIEENTPEDRTITHHLYGGDWENRLKQELLLGVGGIRVMQKLGVRADVYHCNEGHAAFIGLERIHQLMVDKNISFDEAKEVVRSSSLFTTHTPVPAGHDAFDEGLLRKYISHYPERFQISWERLIGLGRVHPDNPGEKFSMSNLALNLSQEVNGVSWLHSEVSREMFSGMYPGCLPGELHISYVTNGVHYPTWTARQWKELYEREFGEGFANHHYDKAVFKKIQDVDNGEIWKIRNELRESLISHIKRRLTDKKGVNYYTPREIVEILETIDSKKLTIGFARRFATYKRAHLLFKNLDTLNEIVNHPAHPVQFIFAGKAHPADKAGQDLIKRIIEISKYPQFLGKIIFLENYDMNLARKLVQGVDIWLNTPTRPQEASGTSGEKAVMNGVMHFSVLDGWWVEGYKPDAGWALPMERMYENDDFQNELDAETIYSVIDNEIAPLFYKRNTQNNIPEEWVQRIKNSIDKVASNFTTNRMLTDYEERFYYKLEKRHKKMAANDYQEAKDLAQWKRKVLREWDSVEVISVRQPSITKEPILLGGEYETEVVMTLGLLRPDEVGVEFVLAEQLVNGEMKIIAQKGFECISHEGSIAIYSLKYIPENTGILSVGIRIYIKNPRLPHRQDFCLVKWA
ncbi:MAG: alpha-glucan family phosphorylase [Prevotellaceae bacterium]|jgi:phosphorylase/glycogen(starch) synthase|nr:alpha-glucan family phosphorylase [Prevotellaceae bacterium]